MIHQCTFMSMGLYLLGYIHKRLPQEQRELGYGSKRSGRMWTVDIGFKQKMASYPLLIQFQNLTNENF